MAIIKNVKTDKSWSSYNESSENGVSEYKFETTPEIYEKAKTVNGYIYVFNKEDFSQFIGMEYRAYTTVKPIRIFEVHFEDLPKSIELVPYPQI